jgi:hypothetical protein
LGTYLLTYCTVMLAMAIKVYIPGKSHAVWSLWLTRSFRLSSRSSFPSFRLFSGRSGHSYKNKLKNGKRCETSPHIAYRQNRISNLAVTSEKWK